MISPFALNTENTTINYRPKSGSNPYGITKKEYRQLVKDTIPAFFDCKIKAIAPKVSDNVKVFFRYARVKNAFQDIIADTLIYNDVIISPDDISDISQRGGGIDRMEFSRIVNQ
nr:MAG TPA: hypothetical protein [Caudoviricetes sp.]